MIKKDKEKSKEQISKEDYINIVNTLSKKKEDLEKIQKDFGNELAKISKNSNFKKNEERYLKKLGDKYAKQIYEIQIEIEELENKERHFLNI